MLATVILLLISGTSLLAQDPPTPMGRFIRQIDGVWPGAITVTPQNQIMLYDKLARRVRIFDLEGNEQAYSSIDARWFEREAHQLLELSLPSDASLALEPKPIDFAVGDDGNLYVIDGANHRLVCLDKVGKQRWSIGGLGNFPGQFVEPTAVALIPGQNTILVTDSQNHRVQAFDLDGKFLYEWGKHAVVPREGEGKIHYPNDIAVSPDGSFVVVAEMFERRVQIFGPLAGSTRTNEDPGYSIPGVQTHFGDLMAVDGRLAAVWEPERRRVLVFDMGRSVPIHITTFGEYGTKLGQFIDITGLAIDEKNATVYILDQGTQRIDVVELDFDPDAPTKFDPLMAKFVRSIALTDAVGEQHGELTGLVRADKDTLALLDTAGGVVHFVSTEGALKKSWKTMNAGVTPVHPVALAVDSAVDKLLVLDDQSRDVIIYDKDGKLLGTLQTAGMAQLKLPIAVCAADDGSYFVVDAGADAIYKYNANGEFQKRWGTSGVDAGDLWMPSAIGIDSQGRVVVLDFGNHRGQLFTQEGEWLATFSAAKAQTRRLKPAADDRTETD